MAAFRALAEQTWRFVVVAAVSRVTKENYAAMKKVVDEFAAHMLSKMWKSASKRDNADAWQDPAFAPEIRQHLLEHVDKGDPVDVAIYAMFAHWHGQSLAPQPVEWQVWRGGKVVQFIPRDAKVFIRLRGGKESDEPYAWDMFDWEHHNSSSDIIAYRLMP